MVVKYWSIPLFSLFLGATGIGVGGVAWAESPFAELRRLTESIAMDPPAYRSQHTPEKPRLARPRLAHPSLDLHALIEATAARNDVPADLLAALVAIESAFNPCAISHAGAQGLTQLMPDTARHLGVMDPFNPAANLAGGARYLRQALHASDGRILIAAAAYNAGPGIARRNWANWPEETRGYVRRMRSTYLAYRGEHWKSRVPSQIMNTNRRVCDL